MENKDRLPVGRSSELQEPVRTNCTCWLKDPEAIDGSGRENCEAHGDDFSEFTDIERLRMRLAHAESQSIYKASWPDGSAYREKWLLHVWHHVPLDILVQACIRAKEDTGPHYLMFMEPEGYVPKADFTCWMCGKAEPHTHAQVEIEAARQTLKVFHDQVWTHLCQAQKQSALSRVPQGRDAWQSIETAPKDGSEILVHDDGAIFISFWNEEEAAWIDNGKVEPPPQQWMPLPAPPASADETP